MSSRRSLLFIAALSVTTALTAPAMADGLVLKRVMLSTGGVAYLEDEAEVTGDAELTLDVPLDQVDDVLKSIVVYDSKGGVGSASLPGREPVAQLFNDLPFDESALASPAALLNALQGAEIRIDGGHPVTGRLLSVVAQDERGDDKVTRTRTRLTVMTATGLQQAILEDADTIAFTDPTLQAQVAKALAALAAHRAKDRRQIVLRSHGAGTRTVRIGYVVAAPLWKGTYRLTLPADTDAEKAHLQGWAVLENMSGQDWHDVELTLLSGNPVSFRQAIYEAYYVTRPEVPVEVAGRILPPPDSGTLTQEAPQSQPRRMDKMLRAGAVGSVAGGNDFAAMAAPPAPPHPPRASAKLVGTAEATEGMTQIAFRIPAPVTIASGRSALVPIVDHDVPTRRVALYQPATAADHPLAAVKVRNDGASGLPPGVITLYEESAQGASYAGDARLSSLPAGEDRLLSYAVDGKTKIARDQRDVTSLTQAGIAEGVLRLTQTDRETIEYQIAAPANEPRHLVLEQPKLFGWHLTMPDERKLEQTSTAYREAIDLKPGEKRIETLVFERPRLETIAIASTDDTQLAAALSTSTVDPAVKQALTQLAGLRRTAAQKKAAQQKIAGDIASITSDQSRIRDNLRSVDQQSALHKRYMDKLAEQETQLEGLQAAGTKAADETHAADAAVDAFIGGLKI
jgi:hypothetical protein